MPRDGTEHEIAKAETPTRRRRANHDTSPQQQPPSAKPIAAKETERRRAATGASVIPSAMVLQPEPIASAESVGGGDRQLRHDTHIGVAISAIVTELVDLQRIRRFCIVSQSRSDRAVESLIASWIGYSASAEAADRKKLFARAKAIRLGVEKGKDGHAAVETHSHHAILPLIPLILQSAASRDPWTDMRRNAEKRMAELARQLPVHGWAKAIKGFGDLSLGIVVAEARIPIGDYHTVSGLWKRMGLAVINGERQRKKTNKADAALHGYSPVRRAEMWACFSDSMFRHQWRAANNETGESARPNGPYGEVYARRRAHTAQRIEQTADLPVDSPDKWTLGRCHNDARRVMTKALLRDLWVEWRRA